MNETFNNIVEFKSAILTPRTGTVLAVERNELELSFATPPSKTDSRRI